MRVEGGLEVFFGLDVFGGDGGLKVGGVEVVGLVFAVLLFAGAGGELFAQSRH